MVKKIQKILIFMLGTFVISGGVLLLMVFIIVGGIDKILQLLE